MTESNFLSKVFLWMFIGLMVTFSTGVLVSGNAQALEFVFSTGGLWILIIAELITVFVLSARIHKMTPIGARFGFILYSFLSGLTFSSVFIAFKVGSIITVFLITAIIMLIFSILGARTKIDLSKLGTYLTMMLIGVIIASIINIFVSNGTFNLVLCIISTVIFIGYIAYDIQKIKYLYMQNPNNENLAVLGALELYLDFINIFLNLLSIFGENNN